MLSIPYRWFFYFYIEQAEVREETFFESTLPGALKAKGGISNESAGDSRIAHVYSCVAELDRGCGKLTFAVSAPSVCSIIEAM